MRTYWIGILAMMASGLTGCLETVPASYGPASLAYELPSESLGEGEHGMPGQYPHLVDGMFSAWSPEDLSWTKEWSDASELEIALDDDERTMWVLFDHQPDENLEYVAVVLPMEGEEPLPGCGILLRGSSETDVDTWTLWAGYDEETTATQMALNNDNPGDAQSGFSVGPSPLNATEGVNNLIAEFSIPMLSGVRKWTLEIPTDDTCTAYESVGGFETVVSGEEGYHTIRPMHGGSISYYAPAQDNVSDTLTFWGVNLDAVTMGPEETFIPVIWGDLASLTPFPATTTGLTNENLSGRVESLPFFVGQDAPDGIALPTHQANVPLTLDGVKDSVEYDGTPKISIGSYGIASRFNGGEQQSWVSHSECVALTAKEVRSLSSAFGGWLKASPLETGSMEEQGVSVSDEGAVELRSWAGAYGAARGWILTCEDTETWMRLEHANHAAGGWFSAVSNGAFVTSAAISWDQSLLTVEGMAFGAEAGSAEVRDNTTGESIELAILEWSNDALSLIVSPEVNLEGMTLVLALNSGDRLHTRL